MTDYAQYLREALAQTDTRVERVEDRTFPGEKWLIAYVPEEKLFVAQSLAGELERTLNALDASEEYPDIACLQGVCGRSIY